MDAKSVKKQLEDDRGNLQKNLKEKTTQFEVLENEFLKSTAIIKAKMAEIDAKLSDFCKWCSKFDCPDNKFSKWPNIHCRWCGKVRCQKIHCQWCGVENCHKPHCGFDGKIDCKARHGN